MDYRGKEVEIEHYCWIDNITFKTDNRIYSFEYTNGLDGRYLFKNKNIAEDKAYDAAEDYWNDHH